MSEYFHGKWRSLLGLMLVVGIGQNGLYLLCGLGKRHLARMKYIFLREFKRSKIYDPFSCKQLISNCSHALMGNTCTEAYEDTAFGIQNIHTIMAVHFKLSFHEGRQR